MEWQPLNRAALGAFMWVVSLQRPGGLWRGGGVLFLILQRYKLRLREAERLPKPTQPVRAGLGQEGLFFPSPVSPGSAFSELALSPLDCT